MSCQVPTVAAVPVVKFPLLPRGLLSYLPANLSSILPRASSTCEASPPPTTTTTMPPAPASPPPPPPKKMAPPPGEGAGAGAQKQQAGSKKKQQADAAELARVFELFDRNGDGRITREELEDSLGKLGIPVPADELAATIARIDANGDGCVDVEEFGELYRSIMADGDSTDGRAKEEEEEEDGDMREAFRVFDANGDGYITVDELGAVLASLGLKQGRTAEECRRMIGQVDRDGDGRVDFHEFLQMMRGGGYNIVTVQL
uniref:EF-hand domain-containing protein n=1 Tax=Oryza punctata TaxID=4537 RepID=A0A0E0KS86_ORYPU